ncbi:MAG: VWA domain-containing protein [Deltaproteobacteria bacterium]|nr:VWA domain-containing protein [Deltaproteobacteria bacterium]MBI2532727.1 VWA domain-containing protein [Deltaproteobacteria bacterium]
MPRLLSQIEFLKPLFFWFLLLLPLVWFRFRDRRLVVIISRTLILLLLILSGADPHFATSQATEEGRIFAYDLSRSIAPAMRRWMEKATEESLVPKRGDRIFVFGAESEEAADWREQLKGENSRQDSIRPEKTSLENLFTKLLALRPAPRNLFLFTDGWETQGSVERLLPAIAAAGLKIYPMVPAEPPSIANVALTKLLAPSHAKSGEAVSLKVVLENQSDRVVEGTLTLSRNGQTFRTESVKLNPGSQIFTYQTTLSEEPTATYRASFTASQSESDRYAADNHAVAWISVHTKAKILLINGQRGGGRYLEDILKRQGFEVASRSADSPPAPPEYKVVVFNNVEREKFSPSYLAAVERHVADGNGFLMLGGEASFSPGGYARTPIESILPVEPKEPKREEKNRAVVLVIDKSGSMREENRILYAQEAAKAVARQLKDNDSLGIVGFDVSAFVLVPLEPVGKLRRVIDGQIDRLKPGGQTYFHPALIEAKRQIERSTAARKHIILLSDGETRGSQGELVDLVGAMKNEMKITVSAVAIGLEADIRIMKRISQYGGGLFHHVIDPTTLPQIVLQQLQDNTKDEPKSERDLIPVQDRRSEVLAGLGVKAYPAVLGFMETELKRGARLDLLIPREDRSVPLLASWRYGRGKSMALTIDMESRWSKNWIPWGSLQAFWEKVMNWLRPLEEPIPLHEARVSLSGNRPILELFAYEEASAASRFRFAIQGKGGKTEGALSKLAPGHYQAALPIFSPGDFRIELFEERQGHRITLPPIGYTLPYELSAEQPRPEFNTGLLLKLAQASGGEINPRSPDSLKKQIVTRSYAPTRQILMILALALFLAEVAARKLLFSEPD